MNLNPHVIPVIHYPVQLIVMVKYIYMACTCHGQSTYQLPVKESLACDLPTDTQVKNTVLSDWSTPAMGAPPRAYLAIIWKW